MCKPQAQAQPTFELAGSFDTSTAWDSGCAPWYGQVLVSVPNYYPQPTISTLHRFEIYPNGSTALPVVDALELSGPYETEFIWTCFDPAILGWRVYDTRHPRPSDNFCRLWNIFTQAFQGSPVTFSFPLVLVEIGANGMIVSGPTEYGLFHGARDLELIVFEEWNIWHAFFLVCEHAAGTDDYELCSRFIRLIVDANSGALSLDVSPNDQCVPTQGAFDANFKLYRADHVMLKELKISQDRDNVGNYDIPVMVLQLSVTPAGDLSWFFMQNMDAHSGRDMHQETCGQLTVALVAEYFDGSTTNIQSRVWRRNSIGTWELAGSVPSNGAYDWLCDCQSDVLYCCVSEERSETSRCWSLDPNSGQPSALPFAVLNETSLGDIQHCGVMGPDGIRRFWMFSRTTSTSSPYYEDVSYVLPPTGILSITVNQRPSSLSSDRNGLSVLRCAQNGAGCLQLSQAWDSVESYQFPQGRWCLMTNVFTDNNEACAVTFTLQGESDPLPDDGCVDLGDSGVSVMINVVCPGDGEGEDKGKEDGLSGGEISAIVICVLLGVGGVVGGAWWYKKHKGSGKYMRIN